LQTFFLKEQALGPCQEGEAVVEGMTEVEAVLADGNLTFCQKAKKTPRNFFGNHSKFSKFAENTQNLDEDS